MNRALAGLFFVAYLLPTSLADARYYDPKTGRFLQEDPVWSPNPYSYVRNNPVNLIDPFGLVDRNLFSKKDPNYQAAELAQSPSNTFTVAGHGNPTVMVDVQGRVVSPEQLADMIRSDPNYHPGMTVQLMSCNVGQSPAEGKASYAQRVADALDGEVEGADNFVWWYSDGSSAVAPTNAPGVTWQNYTSEAGTTGPDLNRQGGYNTFTPAGNQCSAGCGSQ